MHGRSATLSNQILYFLGSKTMRFYKFRLHEAVVLTIRVKKESQQKF